MLFAQRPRHSRVRTLSAALTRLSRLGIALILAFAPALNMVALEPAVALAGSYTLKLYAADPATNNGNYLPTYQKLPPSALTYPLSGRQNNPLPNAVLFASSGTRDAVTSLMPKDTPLGCVVPFELEISVTGSTAPENGTITVTPEWLGKTASGGDFGFDVNYGILAAFVDYGDAGTIDPLNNAAVSRFSSATLGAGTNNERIGGEIVVTGLDQGDRVIVEVWVPLDSVFPTKATGNVSTNMTKAYTGDVAGSGSSISTGNQTIPLLQVGDYATNTADLSLTKTDGPDPVLANGTLTYTLTAKNLSTANTASGVVITDTLGAGLSYVPGSVRVTGTSATVTPAYSSGVLTLPIGALSPLQQVSVSFDAIASDVAPRTATVQSAPDIRDRTNTATITQIGADPVTSNNTATAYTGVVPVPTIAVTKSANPVVVSGNGGDSTFTFTLKNTSPGGQPLSVTRLADSVFGDLSAEVGLPTTVTAGSTYTCSITRFVSPATGDPHQNTATFTAMDAAANLVSASASATVTFLSLPSISLMKTGTWSDRDGDGQASRGDRITYAFTVTNTGNVTLSGVTVTDPLVSVTGGPLASLAPGAVDSGTFTAVYTLTQADVDAGSLTNTAKARGTFGATTVEASGSDTRSFAAAPALMLSKSSDLSEFSAAGEVITYSYLLTNTGNVTLAGPFTVTDDKLGTIAFTGSTLAPGGQLTATAKHTVTQAELDAGPITNTAVAHARFGGTSVDSASASRTVAALQRPSIDLVKVADPNYADSDGDFDYDAGDTITYTLTVKNTGNVTLTNVTVNDPLGIVSGGPLVSLAPGAEDSTTFTASHLVTDAEYASGSFTNSAWAAGTFKGERFNHEDTWTENFDPTVNLELAKTGTWHDANGDGRHSAGDRIDYTFAVTNTGAAPLSNVSITDPLVTVSGGPLASLAPGATDSGTVTASYTLKQADIDAGALVNVATVHAFDPEAVEHFHADADTQNFEQAHTLSLVKVGTWADRDGDGRASKGDVINYAFTVTNTGNVTISNVTVTDPLVAVNGGPLASLAPGAVDSTTFTAAYTLTQADVDTGTLVNTATAGGTFGEIDVTAESSDTQSFEAAPEMSLAKTSDVKTYVAGTVITYTYTLTNTGNVTLAGPFAVSDDKLGEIAFEGDALAPGVKLTATASYTATTADVDAGSITNVATASDGGGKTVSDEASRTVTAAQDASIALVKVGTWSDRDGDGWPSKGDVIAYAFTVTNTGNVTLADVTVSDPLVAVTGGPLATLAPGAEDSSTFTATYTVTQADIDAGSFTNAATAHGNFGETEVTGEASDTQSFPAAPSLLLSKSSDLAEFSAAGDVITYSYLLTNTGNVTLSGPFTVTDDKLGTITFTGSTLAPGGQLTATAKHTATQAELDAGPITNTAVGHASFGGDTLESDPASRTVTALQQPGLEFTKTANPNPAGADVPYEAGDTITYTLTVTNTGNVTLTNVTVSDARGVVSGGPLATLVPGAVDSTTFSASHVVTETEHAFGVFTNTARATGIFAGEPYHYDDAETVSFDPEAGLSLTKTGTWLDANADGMQSAGDVVTYAFTVTNTGTTPLFNVQVTDPLVIVRGLPILVLNPGTSNSTAFTATYFLTQADIEAGVLVNTATVKAKDLTDTEHVSGAADTQNFEQVHTLAVGKYGSFCDCNEDGIPNAGDEIRYAFIVTNTGNVTLTNVTVTDPLATVTGGPLAILAPGAVDSATFTAVYTLTQEDIDAGSLTNTATAHGTFGETEVTAEGSDTQGFPASPALMLGKSSDVATYTAGTLITYTYTLTNIGNVTVNGPFTASDDKLGEIAFTGDTLAPGAKLTATASYTATTADVERGSITNVATAMGTRGTSSVPSDPVERTVTAEQAPSIALVKTGTWKDKDGDKRPSAGDTVTYAFTVTNTGNVTLTNVRVADPLVIVSGGPVASLAPGGVDGTTFTAVYTLTQQDIDAGSLTNTATASGSFGETTVEDEGTDTQSFEAAPALTLAKSSDESTYTAGTKITYTYTLTNIGNVTLDGPFSVSDDKLGQVWFEGATLAPGGQLTATASYTATTADVEAGSITNTASARGAFGEATVSSDEAQRTVTAEQAPSIALVKTGTWKDKDGDKRPSAGDTVTYAFTVTNTGNVTLSGVTVTDGLAPIEGGPLASLAPGAVDSTAFTAVYTLKQVDIDAGTLINTARASGSFGETSVEDEASDTRSFEQYGSLELVKAGTWTDRDGDGRPSVGDVIEYAFTVTNTGNVTVTAITVSDPNADVTGGPLAALAPGASDSTTFRAAYVLRQSDIDAGSVSNTAEVVGIYGNKGRGIAIGSGTDVRTLAQMPSIKLVKTGTWKDEDGDNRPSAGDIVTYAFTVTNTGNVTLTNVRVADPLVIVSGGPVASLAPGGVDGTTFTAVYTLTQADVDAGTLTNTATASGTFGETTVEDDASDTRSFEAAPSMSLAKSSDVATYTAGTVITYSYLITNTGNVTLSGPFTVTDDKLGTLTLANASPLAPGGQRSVTAKHTATQAQTDAGSITNTAIAHASFGGGAVDSAKAERTVDAVQTPALALEKTGTRADTDGDGRASKGDVVTYTLTVTNTGTVMLRDIAVTDPLAIVTGDAIAFLIPGGKATFTATHALTQAEVDAGTFTNTATASGTFGTQPPVSAQGSATITLAPEPALALVKTPGVDTYAAVGDVITYSYLITNTGNTTLAGMVAIRDDRETVQVVQPADGALSPGESTTGMARRVVTQDDLDAKEITNVAYAEVGSVSSPTTAVTVRATLAPKIGLAETGKDVNGGTLEVGDVIEWTIRVCNKGNCTLTNVRITNPVPGMTQFIPGSMTGPGAITGGLTPARFSPATAEVAVSSGPLTWVLPVLCVGDCTTLTFRTTVLVKPPDGEMIVSQATAEANEPLLAYSETLQASASLGTMLQTGGNDWLWLLLGLLSTLLGGMAIALGLGGPRSRMAAARRR